MARTWIAVSAWSHYHKGVMASSGPPLRLRPVLLLGTLLAGGAAGTWLLHGSPPLPPLAAPASLALALLAPSFDIVRVSPDGSAVIAGQAAPGTAVVVRQGGQPIGETQADAHGAWVLVPAAKLPPGARDITLSSRDAAGREAQADAPVLVVVPQPAAPLPALALLAPPHAPSRLLQAPGGDAPGRTLGLGTVDYDEHGAIRFSGTAPPMASVRVYVDDLPVGDAMAGLDGHWGLLPPGTVPPGMHHLRLDQLTATGQVAHRMEQPFQRETMAASQAAAGQVVVQPGQTLWLIARHSYGSGVRYTLIFLANQGQIRDAKLIYPGQVFTIPGASAR